MFKKEFSIITLIVVILKSIECVPVSPCPMIFHYEYDGEQWIGVAKIYPQIYNRFRIDKITLNLTLVINRHIPNVQNFRLLELYKSLQDTYHDIATRKPIVYRISFPFRTEFPELLKIQLNGMRICRNHRKFYAWTHIHLGFNINLPTIDAEEEQTNDYDDYDDMGKMHQFNPNQPPISHPFLNRPSVIMQRVDEDTTISLNPRWNHRLEATQECGKYDEQFQYSHLISGGEKIVPGTWPWLVAIFHKQTSNLVFQCTGNLISNHVVLTAAHCFKMDSKGPPTAANEIMLSFGRHDIKDWAEDNIVLSDVDEIVLHPDYLNHRSTKIFDADIAIVITKDFIEFNSVIKPICLWPAEVDSTLSIVGMNGTLVGWGQPHENLQTNVPRRLSMPVVRDQFCFPSERSSHDTDADQSIKTVFCAGNAQAGNAPCAGDSGSGFAIHANGAWFLRGLVSAALGDPILNRCDLNTYVIFTDISHYSAWIDNYI